METNIARNNELEQIKAELERIRAENAKLSASNSMLKKASNSRIAMKVSEKGALSVYGLGRFPVTLYKQQWERLIETIPALQEFITAHDSELSVKQ